MTYEELHAEMVAAMKAKDKVRLGVTRLVLGELKNAASRGGAHEISEEETTAQIKRTLTQTNEPLAMSEQAVNNPERTENLREKDKVRLGVTRLVLGELKNAASRGGAHEISEEETTAQIKRTLKQTNETLEMSEKAGNNPERTENLREQVAVLESLLPKQVSGDELVSLVERVIAELGATSKKDMGRVMGALTAATNGNFDKPPSWAPRPKRTWAA